jgi:hypothetical protein
MKRTAIPPLHGEGQTAKRSGWGSPMTSRISQNPHTPTLTALSRRLSLPTRGREV